MGFLNKGQEIGLFLYKEYDFNTLENITLTTLWNFVYNLKFSSDKFAGIKFNYFLKNSLCKLTTFPPPLSLKAREVVRILDLEFPRL